MFPKEIICLANSEKLQGRCIAGKDIETHDWVRPISNNKQGELSVSQIQYKDQQIPSLLDIIKINFDKEQRIFYQPENILIDITKKWEKVGVFPKDELDKLCDTPETIFSNMRYKNDRISEDYLKEHKIKNSLLLIKPEIPSIVRENYIDDAEKIKKKVRIEFTYNTVNYNFVVTDPLIRNRYKEKEEGTYPLKSENIYLCISLGVPFNNCCYKLVASIIFTD